MKYFKPKTKLAIRLAIFIKSLTGSAGFLALVSDYKWSGIIIIFAGAILNELINFLSDGTCEVIDEVIKHPEEVNCKDENK